MTEAEKSALTGLCKIEIKRWKVASESNPNMRYMVELMELALASLEAEPVYWEIAGNLFSSKEEAFKPGYRGTPEPLFEFPPAAAMVLPEKWKGEVRYEHDLGEEIGWNSCLDEIKRLNGLEVSDGE